MLAAHPAVAYMPETSFLRRYVATGALDALFASDGEGDVIAVLEKDAVFARSGLNVTSLVQQTLTTDGLLDAAIYRAMVRAKTSDEQPWVGDKDPRLIEYLSVVGNVFSDAQVVNIIRDPRDVLASKKKAAWSSGGHVWKHIFANRIQLKLGCMEGPRLFKDQFHEIIYEELISSPREVLGALCRKIGLPFDDAMLSFGEAAKELVSKSELGWKKETFGPLLKDNKEKWKKSLPPREIVLTEICCGEAMAIGNYAPDDRKHKFSFSDRLWIMAGATVIKLGTFPYMVYRNFVVARACKRLG